MSFKINFDTITHQFSVDVDGIMLKYSFDGKTLTIEGKVKESDSTSASMSSCNANMNASVPSTNNINVQSIVPPPIQYVGVTSYINAVIPRMSNSKVLDAKPYYSSNIIPDDALTVSICNGQRFMYKIHYPKPTLNGVCIEGLLYLALKRKLLIDTTITEPFNFNTIFNTDLLATHKEDTQFRDLFERVDNACAYQDNDFKGVSEITYSKLDLSTSNVNVMVYIIYLAMYAYINIEKRGFPRDNYSTDDIFDYCSKLMSDITGFESLIEYINAIASYLMTPDSIIPVSDFVPDVPIKEFMTKNYYVNGSIDLLAITGSKASNLQSAWIYDCKCCKCDDDYVETKWPQQLNLYAKGMRDVYDIEGLCVVNIYTNHMFRYNIIKGLDSVELD